MNIHDLGHFPAEGNAARESKAFYKVTSDTALHVVSGRNSPVLLKVFASNDVVTLGECIIPTGGIGPRQTEYDQHPGDAVFYIKSGPLTFLMPDTVETFHVQNGDFMFIPENTRYKIINYTAELGKAIFIVAPEL